MNPDILKVVGQVAGLGGIVVLLATVVFRDIIRRNIFPNLTKHQAYSLLRLIVLLASILALAGITAWVYVTVASQDTPEEQLRRRAEQALEVPPADRVFFADFLQQDGTHLFRLHPREGNRWIEAAGIQGGGSYYSFLRRNHEHGYGSEIVYGAGVFGTGFAGADYGYILPLGDVSIQNVIDAGREPPSWLDPSQAGAWTYMWTYQPPSDINEVRQHQRQARGFVIGDVSLSERSAAIDGMSYLLRAILIDEADLLIGFRAHRQLADGSFVIAGKIMRSFATPIATGAEQ